MIQKFELTIDIESLIEETDKDASGELDRSLLPRNRSLLPKNRSVS